ncbi:pre-mRNA-splicing factor SLU7 [Cyclospora cayetanensis]|uniref:Pre-mRNA-splicing factor SLU7 n=1 Tax=Cyclospora cayetanensis TaxID=88456 RepID=A0A6P6RRI3_9EIME|nr:pre-mRNA-splicing factor SLU7 [Cyclospora cayetanensis]
MWIGRIGKKSAAFINHKPFHPGNYQNQEKVWLAEQKQKEEQKKEKELEERRREEVKIEELRRALRGEAKAALQLQNKEGEVISPAEELQQKAREAARQQALQRKQQEAHQRLKQPAKSSLYSEDVFILGHTSVFGSYYSRGEQKWGFSCCKCLERSARCPLNQAEEQRINKRKHRNGCQVQPADAVTRACSSPKQEEKDRIDEARDGILTDTATSSPSNNGEAGSNFHATGMKKRAREGGVAAYLKLMETTDDGD